MLLAAIGIPFDPNIFDIGNFRLSWHGLLSVVAVIAAIIISVRGARRLKIDPDYVYNVALFGILGGIIGARIVHVADEWSTFVAQGLGSFFLIWEGGVGLWGGILGGWLAGLTFAFLAGYPWDRIGKLMDIAAPGMLIAQTIGRVGDIINGEHCSRATDLPWGWFFTHPDSPARFCISGNRSGYFAVDDSVTTPVHPTVVYEMIWNIMGLGILYLLRDRLKPAGSIWFIYLVWYSIGRFGIQWLRLDRVHFLGLQEAHIIAILVFAVIVPVIILKTRIRKSAA